MVGAYRFTWHRSVRAERTSNKKSSKSRGEDSRQNLAFAGDFDELPGEV